MYLTGCGQIYLLVFETVTMLSKPRLTATTLSIKEKTAIIFQIISSESFFDFNGELISYMSGDILQNAKYSKNTSSGDTFTHTKQSKN